MATKKLKPYNKSGLYRAIIAVGGLTELSKQLTVMTGKPVSRQSVFNWRKNGRVPSWFIPHIHELTNIPLIDLLEPYEPVYPSSDDDE